MNGNKPASSVMLRLVNEVMRAAQLMEADTDRATARVPVQVL